MSIFSFLFAVGVIIFLIVKNEAFYSPFAVMFYLFLMLIIFKSISELIREYKFTKMLKKKKCSFCKNDIEIDDFDYYSTYDSLNSDSRHMYFKFHCSSCMNSTHANGNSPIRLFYLEELKTKKEED